MGHVWKNGSHLEKSVTLGKMGHTLINESHLEKWVIFGKLKIIGTLSIDNEMHDDDVRNPRRIGSRVSFLVGKRKVKQCVVF